jgi:primosomal protein N' (replication factor Y)
MSDKNIACITLGVPLVKVFDYNVPKHLQEKIKVGARVRVSFHGRPMVGYVKSLSSTSKIKSLKPISVLIDEEPLFSGEYLLFLSQVAGYYCASTGEVIDTAIPALLRQGRVVENDSFSSQMPNFPPAKLSKESAFQGVVYQIQDAQKKEDFYLEKISDCLKASRQVILLLPDIALIDKWQKLFEDSFKNVRIAILHSRMKPKEALSSWLKAYSGQVDIVIGSRCSVFAPLANIGLIIVDSEDNFVYKQETRPFYNARDVAIILAKRVKATLILSGVSPSLEAFQASELKHFVFLKSGVSDQGQGPAVKMIDLKTQASFKQRAVLSRPLVESIRRALEQKKRVLIFLNRRGFATALRCRHCGYTLVCQRCSSQLIYYYHTKMLECPHCNYKLPQSHDCPQCRYPLVYFAGVGVERLESEAYRLFPAAKIICIDSRNKKSGIDSYDIIIATQMGLKEGLIAEKLDLCAVVSLDTILNVADFRSSEQVFRIAMGLRSLTKEEMLIQSFVPNHRVFRQLISADYDAFARQELQDRKVLRLPPFRHLVAINLKSTSQDKLNFCAGELFSLLSKRLKKEKNAQVFAPIRDIPFRLRSKFRLQILINTAKVEDMNKIILKVLSGLKSRHAVLISVNVDV